jgi:hypothetical protein
MKWRREELSKVHTEEAYISYYFSAVTVNKNIAYS